MGLQPLEFSECLTDSPYFRDKLHAHEKELDRTSKSIKLIMTECKELISAARNLSKAQRSFSSCLTNFKFDCIGSEQTEDEVIIGNSLKEFGRLISAVEDERDRMLDRAFDQIIRPLDAFRKDQIGGAKEGKKKFDKQTNKFCQSLDRYLGLKTKAGETSLSEADSTVEFERKQFYRDSMQYVLTLQEVQERKKFEFVETLLSFMYSWLTFLHHGHEVAEDHKPFMTDLQLKLQKSRDNFETTRNEAKSLMERMLEKSQQGGTNKTCTREGYLFMQEKKALTTTWNKYYCLYQKENKILTMIPYNQVTAKGVSGITTETAVLTSCTRRAQDSIDKRFCFDITVQDRNQPYTLQALSEEDRRLWLDAMDGKEPLGIERHLRDLSIVYSYFEYGKDLTTTIDRDVLFFSHQVYSAPCNKPELDSECLLDDVGFQFIKKCIYAVETRGLEDEGLYRVVGVSSKVNKLTSMGLDRRKADKLQLAVDGEWEVKTITSAIKHYFRSLPEPLLTFNLYQDFIQAAKKEAKTLRVNDVHELAHKLPEHNFEMLKLLICHLTKISEQCAVNRMTVANLGVCFGPTLLRAQEECMAAIMDIKFCNLVVEILIDNYQLIFNNPPEFADITNTRVLNAKPAPAPKPEPQVDPPKPVAPPAMSNSFHSPSPMVAAPASMTSSWAPTNHSVGSSSPPLYVSSDGPTYAQYRAKLRPTGGIYSQYSPGELQSTGSGSSSTESLNSKCSASSAGTPQPNERRPNSNGSQNYPL
ncbi:hypothetical protein CAPTEDRAFT_224027, partial [Capitella teleta]